MIYFGTGKYFETGDGTIAANPQVESFYGIWDQNLTVTDRANLQEQTIIFEGFATTNTGAQTANRQRVLSQNPVCYSITSPGCTANNSLKKGWAINLLESGVNAKGERVVTRPLVRMGVVIFTTMIPDPDPCTGGGTGWIMLVNALTGGRSDAAQYDTNGDSVVNSSDLITANGNKYAASGLDPRIGLLTSSIVIEGTPTSYLVTNAANGTNSVGIAGNPPPPSITPTGTPPPTPPPSGRQSWRQLR
jgi:type IV pilus assembly protein PilY1